MAMGCKMAEPMAYWQLWTLVVFASMWALHATAVEFYVPIPESLFEPRSGPSTMSYCLTPDHILECAEAVTVHSAVTAQCLSRAHSTVWRLYTCVCTYLCTRLLARTCIRPYTRLHVCWYDRLRVHVCTCLFTYLYRCLHTCLYTYVYRPSRQAHHTGTWDYFVDSRVDCSVRRWQDPILHHSADVRQLRSTRARVWHDRAGCLRV